MNLKYYLRGLGIGIVVTVILMGVATKGDNQMTDAEIKERAAQLGMVETKVLADISGNETQQKQEDILQMTQPTVPPEVLENKEPEVTEGPTMTEEPEVTEGPTMTEEPEMTEEPTMTEEPEMTEEPTMTAEPEVTEEPVATENEGNGETITIIIHRGASSWTVSKDLEEYGLIEDAKEFDNYLSRKGYDKSISIGEFEIAIGTTYEEIAKIITKRN